MKLFKILGFSFILGLANTSFAADSTKVGTVDMQKALQTVDAGKKAKSELEGEFNKKKKTLQKEEETLKKMHEEFQKKSMVMSEQARNKKQAELQERFMKLQQQTAQSQAEIQKKEQELTEPLIKKIREIISEIAKKKNYTVILEKNDNNVLFSKPEDDLTSEVIDQFNKKKSG